MLGETIKRLRKKMGYSQETLAQQLNVVRQTVSKWEKGISVPDADMLTRMGELFEVTVEELLGAEVQEKADTVERNEIAAQLAILNEQLANQNRRRRKVIKRTALGVFILLAVLIALYLAAFIGFRYYHSADALTTTDLFCTLDGEEYVYGISYDDQYRIVSAGGDAFIADHVQTERYEDANMLIAQIEDYFTDRGGTCKKVEQAEKKE